MYNDWQYANSRLSGTIVRKVCGSPFYVLEVRNGECIGRDLLAQKNESVKFKDMDLSPVPLGFASNASKDRVAFLARKPMRQDWRQGLRPNNYRSLWGNDARSIPENSLVATIMGRFTGFSNALDLVDNEGGLVPFSRNFCLGFVGGKEEVAIFYKWHGAIGDVVNGIPQLFDRFQHINEHLLESINANP